MKTLFFAKILLLVTVGLPAVLAADCNATLVRLPIKNVTTSSGKIRRGVEMQVGTPPQALAFQPKWDNNNSYVFGPKCQSEDFIHTAAACEVFRGGMFSPDKSTSKGSTNQSFVPPRDPYDSSSYSYFTDIVSSSNKAFLDNFPLGSVVNSSDWGLQANRPLNIIGMATGSLFLDTLYQTGRIASRSFGYFWGLDGTSSRDRLDGSFVLGGYDRAKTIGTAYTGSIAVRENCPTGLTVTIRDIVLNFRSGQDASIFPSDNGGTALLACVYPELPVFMKMPRDPQFRQLLKLTDLGDGTGRSTGIHWWNVLVDDSIQNPYDGDMTLKFDGGFQVTVPNRLLIVPETKISDSGDIISNSSSKVILIDSLQSTTAQSMPALGRDFFSVAYLQSNQDSGKFSIWQLNPTPDEDLVVVDEKNAIVTGKTTCPGPTAGATTPSAQPDSKSSPGGQDNKALSTGAIAGIAVGAVCAVALLGVLAWFLLRKKKSKSEAIDENKDNSEHDLRGASKSPGGASGYYQSLYAPQHSPGELPVQNRDHSPVEMPAEYPAHSR